MTQSHAAGTTTRPRMRPTRMLTEHENSRAVDIIESAEREAPHCLCGSHMLAVARRDGIWLECADQAREKTGLGGLLARLAAFNHTRRMIMEVPAAN